LSSGDSPSWCVSSGPSAAQSLDEHYGRDHLLTTDLLSSSLIAERGIRLRLRFTAFVLSYPTRAVRDSCGKYAAVATPICAVSAAIFRSASAILNAHADIQPHEEERSGRHLFELTRLHRHPNIFKSPLILSDLCTCGLASPLNAILRKTNVRHVRHRLSIHTMAIIGSSAVSILSKILDCLL
jgi:hypothetical protein